MAAKNLVRWLLAIAGMCWSWTASSLDNKPHIVVDFAIEAPAFKMNLPQRSEAQRTVGSQVAALIAQRLAYADWVIAPREDQARLGSLRLKLEEEPNTVPSPRIVVKWYGGPDAASVKLLPIPEVELYAATNPNWDTNNRATFESRVLDRMRNAMQSDAFYDRLFNVFARTLPIAKQVRASPTDRAIDVPVNWRDLLLAPESIVVVQFRPNPPSGADPGQLTLNPVMARRVVDSQSNVVATQLRGAVEAALVGVHTLDLVDNWNNQLPTLLSNSEVRAYLVEYKPLDFADTGDGLALNFDR